MPLKRLTLTLVVFECFKPPDLEPFKYSLTLTLVVFEYNKHEIYY